MLFPLTPPPWYNICGWLGIKNPKSNICLSIPLSSLSLTPIPKYNYKLLKLNSDTVAHTITYKSKIICECEAVSVTLFFITKSMSQPQPATFNWAQQETITE